MYNYSIDVFYNPILVLVNSKFSSVMFCFDTISFLLMMYVILFNGKSLEIYRWMLLLCFISTYGLGAILTAGHLVQLLPAILGYFDGFLGNFIDALTLFVILVIVIALKMLTFCFLVIYRYAMGVPGKLQDFLLEKKNLYFAYFGTISISFIPLLIFFVPLENVDKIIEEDAPMLYKLPFKSKLIGTHINPMVVIIITILLIFLIFGQFFIAYLIVQMHFSVKQMQSNLSQATHNLQKALYISVVIESIIGFITTSFPTTIALFMAVFSFPYASYVVTVLLMLVEFQITLSTISQCYFIKPFRKAVLNLLLIPIKKCGKKNQNSITVVKPPATGSILRSTRLATTNV